LIANAQNIINEYIEKVDFEKNINNYMAKFEKIIEVLCKHMEDDGYDFHFQYNKFKPFHGIKKIVSTRYIASKFGITVEEFKKLEHAHNEFLHIPDIEKLEKDNSSRKIFYFNFLAKFFNCSLIIEKICLNLDIKYEIYISNSSEKEMIDHIKNIELSFRDFIFLFYGEEKIKVYNNLKKMYKYDYIKFWEKKSGRANTIINGTTFHELKNIFLDKRNFRKYSPVLNQSISSNEKYFKNYKRFYCYILEDVLIASNKIRHWNPVTKTQIEAIKFYNYYLPMVFNQLCLGIYLRLYNSEFEKE
jgi:hypothetical protein